MRIKTLLAPARKKGWPMRSGRLAHSIFAARLRCRGSALAEALLRRALNTATQALRISSALPSYRAAKEYQPTRPMVRYGFNAPRCAA